MKKYRILIPILILSIAFLQEFIDQIFFGGSWNLPLVPRSSLWYLFTAPFSHSGFGHLLSNALIFFPLSLIVLSESTFEYFGVLVFAVIFQLPIWLFTINPVHGLSGIVYGLLGYLLTLGLIQRNLLRIISSILIAIIFSDYLFALIPIFSQEGISWIGHTCGFFSGILAASILSRLQNN